MIGTGVFVIGTGVGVTGAGVTGTGVTGAGVTGAGVCPGGTGVAGAGVGVLVGPGAGVRGAGVAGTDVIGAGVTGTGVTGMGVAGTGVGGMGVTGVGVTVGMELARPGWERPVVRVMTLAQSAPNSCAFVNPSPSLSLLQILAHVLLVCVEKSIPKALRAPPPSGAMWPRAVIVTPLIVTLLPLGIKLTYCGNATTAVISPSTVMSATTENNTTQRLDIYSVFSKKC